MFTPPSSVKELLDLAHRHEAEETEFATFLENVRQLLRRPQFPHDGSAVSLAEYLDGREAQGAARLPGDEQSVVVLLVRQLLEALGYSAADAIYNRPLPAISERAVPDFTVFVRDLLGSTPVFLVECKSTSVAYLSGPGLEQGAGETAVRQLRRYVLSGVVHGRLGLLCNGFRLEAWEYGSEGDTRLVQVDLHALARQAAGEAEAFSGELRGGLRTVWYRLSRSAFVRAHDLQRVSAQVPPLPSEWVERVRARFEETVSPSALEEDLVAYYESAWEETAIDVSDSPELLVDSLRGLIGQFAEDVLHQLGEGLRRHEEHEAARQVLEGRSQLSRLRQPLELHRQSFLLTPEQFEEILLQPLEVWCRRPRLEDLEERVAAWVADLEPHVRKRNESDNEQLALKESGPTVRRRGNGPEIAKKRVIRELTSDLEVFCRAALEEHSSRRQLEEQYKRSLDVAAAFQTWAARVSSSVLVGAAEAEYRREFSRQTAYVYVVRLLLVRICEDKKLFQRKISDGGLTLWQGCAARYLDYASGRSYEYLTRMAYECAQNVYVHFYGASELFDWYRMDEKMMVRALLVLNAFNLEAIDTDIIGAVYGRYLEEGKHEQGRYYTPRELVRTMLDLVGYRGEAVVNRRIADLACGSGSFLVEACRRLLDQFRGSDGKIPAARLAPALEEVQKSLYGVEINPFACYLAETNLLIQVLDLVRQAQETESTLTVERFRIYSGDALLVDPVLAATKDTTLLLLGEDRAVLEQLKARVGPFEGGFDFLVGNPPYVRADEDSPSYLAYRRLLDRQDWFTTGHLKWDLYVPFVEQYHRLLADQPKARCCLVTIESLTNAPYAAKLRQLLGAETTLHDVLFTQGLRLFEDATWQNNVVFCFSRGVSSGEHRVQRRISRRRADDGSLLIELMDQPDQKAHDPDALFRLRERVDLDLKQTVRWEEICYVSVGMVLNSDEKREEGAVIVVPSKYDPQCFGEELVKNLGKRGKRIRHRRFKREELLSNDRDTIHTRPYLDSREVLRGGIGRIKWLEYGPHTRVPARVRRPTFPELYDRPKVVFGSFIGVAVDDGSNQEFLVAPHNVRISILWWRMADIENRALDSVRTALDEEGRYDSALSRLFSEWYLCALALSEPVQRWLHATRRSMKDDVYPDDIRAIPVKRLSQQDQQPFVRLEQERHRLWRELIELEGRGFRIGERVRIPVRELAGRFREEHPEIEHLTLFQMPTSVLEIDESAYEKDLSRVRAIEGELRVGKEAIGRVGEKIRRKADVAKLFARFLQEMPGTLADRQSRDALPRSEEGLLALAGYLEEQEKAVRRRQARIEEIQAEIDRRAWDLYRPGGR